MTPKTLKNVTKISATAAVVAFHYENNVKTLQPSEYQTIPYFSKQGFRWSPKIKTLDPTVTLGRIKNNKNISEGGGKEETEERRIRNTECSESFLFLLTDATQDHHHWNIPIPDNCHTDFSFHHIQEW